MCVTEPVSLIIIGVCRLDALSFFWGEENDLEGPPVSLLGSALVGQTGLFRWNEVRRRCCHGFAVNEKDFRFQ